MLVVFLILSLITILVLFLCSGLKPGVKPAVVSRSPPPPLCCYSDPALPSSQHTMPLLQKTHISLCSHWLEEKRQKAKIVFRTCFAGFLIEAEPPSK